MQDPTFKNGSEALWTLISGVNADSDLIELFSKAYPILDYLERTNQDGYKREKIKWARHSIASLCGVGEGGNDFEFNLAGAKQDVGKMLHALDVTDPET